MNEFIKGCIWWNREEDKAIKPIFACVFMHGTLQPHVLWWNHFQYCSVTTCLSSWICKTLFWLTSKTHIQGFYIYWYLRSLHELHHQSLEWFCHIHLKFKFTSVLNIKKSQYVATRSPMFFHGKKVLFLLCKDMIKFG